jgi:hypothetical protein
MSEGLPLIQALCHIFKYPAGDVCGVFLASSSDKTTISGCAPLFHSTCVTTPLLRSSLSLLDTLEDRVIVAIYYASANDSASPVYIKQLQSQIENATGRQIAVLKLDIESIQSHSKDFFKGDVDNLLFEGSTACMDMIKDILDKRKYLMDVMDFEDHLNDPHRDWLRFA